MASLPIAPVPSTPTAALACVLGHIDRDKLGTAVEVLIALLDAMDAPDDPEEPDFAGRSDGLPGEPADHEPGGDDRDVSWPEWHQRNRRKGSRASHGMQNTGGFWGTSEDDEQDDEPEEDDHCGQADEDGINTVAPQAHLCGALDGPGCPISDPCGLEPGEVERPWRHTRFRRPRLDR